MFAVNVLTIGVLTIFPVPTGALGIKTLHSDVLQITDPGEACEHQGLQHYGIIGSPINGGNPGARHYTRQY